MRISYFLVSCSCFVLFRFCQRFISTNSVRRVRVSWLYKETLTLQKSSYHDQVYHSFCGGLTSEYQVVRNQSTPLVIVQIVLDLVTPSPFLHSCRTYFITNIVLIVSIAHNLEFNFRLPLYWIEALTPSIKVKEECRSVYVWCNSLFHLFWHPYMH